MRNISFFPDLVPKLVVRIVHLASTFHKASCGGLLAHRLLRTTVGHSGVFLSSCVTSNKLEILVARFASRFDGIEDVRGSCERLSDVSTQPHFINSNGECH